jgi:hypothetical protein
VDGRTESVGTSGGVDAGVGVRVGGREEWVGGGRGEGVRASGWGSSGWGAWRVVGEEVCD